MRNRLTFIIRGAIGSALIVLPFFAQAADLSVSPVLLESGRTVGGTAAPSASTDAKAATPLSLSGYAQWESPTKTLETVGYGAAESRSSFGAGLPLKDALRLILPSGWRIYAQPGVSGTVPVTWKAKGEPWTDTLKDVLRQSGLIATVNWPNRAVLLRVRPEPKTPPLDIKGYAAWGAPSSASALPAHFHVGAATAESAGTAIPSLANATPVFLLNQGDLILTDLQKWAKQSGWTVIWQVPEDWQVPNTTTFSGNFQKAVTQVIQALSANGANVHAVFHTANNTVVISGAGGGE